MGKLDLPCSLRLGKSCEESLRCSFSQSNIQATGKTKLSVFTTLGDSGTTEAEQVVHTFKPQQAEEGRSL